MAGDHYRQSGYVTLQDVPDPNREYVETFQNLTGGINRFDLDYRLKGNESPFMQNLSWHNGTLTSRLGQVQIGSVPTGVKSVAPFLFDGWLLVQTQDRFRGYKLVDTGDGVAVGTACAPFTDPTFDADPGTWFRYRENVYYKAKGWYIRFSKDGTTIRGTSIHDGENVSTRDLYVPLIQINSDPDTGAGDQFQSENRLSAGKKVQYNAKSGVTVYHLPVTNITSVVLVRVDGRAQPDTAYTVDATAGTVTFNTAPPVTDPPTNNTVEIWYRKEDEDSQEAYASIMDSEVATVFGGTQDLCVVMGGTPAQPNAYFWSGHNGNTLDPSYFPMEQYNLVGDNDDPITAMGKQQNMLVIFQPNSTGRAVFGTETINGLERLTMNYTRINAEIGCDLPGSLQLIENNLVWCHRKYGVCRLKDSSAAYENNITVISRKINGDLSRVVNDGENTDYANRGLLWELREFVDGVLINGVHSVDTGTRYILSFGADIAYEWNYELSSYDNPSWFYHTGIVNVGYVAVENTNELYEVTLDGKIVIFAPVFSDFGTEPINKIYRFPPRDFGSYDRLKNIKSILVTTRSDAKTNTQLKYTCDYAERIDPTNLVVILNRLLYAAVFRRKPGYHNIHHLGIELSNNVAGDDLNIVSAQIFYEYRGRTR